MPYSEFVSTGTRMNTIKQEEQELELIPDCDLSQQLTTTSMTHDSPDSKRASPAATSSCLPAPLTPPTRQTTVIPEVKQETHQSSLPPPAMISTTAKPTITTKSKKATLPSITTTTTTPSISIGQQHANPNSNNNSNIPVQAYAKLEGEDFCYYIRTLQVTLGRKAMTPDTVDIPLGNTKSVSRHHARLFYNFSTQRFEMMVFGKNGAFVNERFVECGATVPLENRTKIQIGDVAFVFLLPRIMDMDESHHHHQLGDRRTNDRDDGLEEGGGYISTPRQLEKNRTTGDMTQESSSKQQQQQSKRSSQKISRPINIDVDGGYNFNKNVKPPYSYAAMIAQAINSCPEKKMTLSSIYAYITTHFPYYQMTQNGWQNSIRHNLSLNKAFLKVPRKDDEPGKGAFWAIDANVDTQFLNGIYKRNKRASPQQQQQQPTGTNSESRHQQQEEGQQSNATSVAEENITIDQHQTKRIKSEPSIQEEENISQRPKQEDVSPLVKAEPKTHEVKKEVDTKSSSPTLPSITDQNQSPHTKDIPNTVVEPLNNNDNKKEPSTSTPLQMQLQQTIRQHLLDPVRHPLPPSIAQLLPQAIAQLPITLQTQLSATLQAALRAHQQQQQQQKGESPTAHTKSPSPPPPSK